MAKNIIWDADVECTSCGGTGLYKGFAEGDGAAVVCRTCDGTGKQHVHYEFTSFTERKKQKGVKRVYKTAAGYGIAAEDFTTKDGVFIPFSQAGVSYKDWLNGVKPKPIKRLHCPLQHFDQGTEIGEWLKDRGPCYQKLSIGGYIPDCSRVNRDSCWEWFSTCKYAEEE